MIYGIFLATGLTIVLFSNKIVIQTTINSLFHPIGNYTFLFFTRMAEGWGTIPLLLILLWKNWRWFVYIGIIYGMSALFTWALKQFVFPKARRPYGDKIIRAMSDYNWVETLSYPKYNSFPSGHTTTAFCLCFGLALLVNNKRWSSVLVVLASLIGMSRTYLSYHFFTDVLAGSFVGVATAALFYQLLQKKLNLK